MLHIILFWNNDYYNYFVTTLHVFFISVINQLYVQNLFYDKFITCLYMFRAHVPIIRKSKLHYTASGIITPIGCRPVHSPQPVHETATYSCDDTRGCVMQL